MHAKVLSILFIIILSSSSISQLANATSAGVISAQYQLYENTQYGFSLEYPKDWTLVEHMGSQYTAKTVLVEPNDSLQFSAGVFKNSNPYAGLTNTEILGTITTMMRNGCSNSSFQNRGFTCTGPQFTTNATSYHSVPLYGVVMVWTKTFSDGQSTKWVSMWGMIPSGNDVWLMIMEGSPDEFTKYQQEIAHVADSFVIDSISQQNVAEQARTTSQDVSEQTNFVIPGWVKNNAKWWSEGSVTDDDFIKALQYMIQNGIIVIPSTHVSSSQNPGMPSWLKNNAKWWSEGQLSDDDFIKGIQYMIQNGIIVVQNNNGQTTTHTPGVSTPDFSKPPILDLPVPGTPILVTPTLGASKP